MSSVEWKPFREPLRQTLLRVVGIAVVAGAVVALRRGGIHLWPVATLLLLWPTFGGHWVEVFFLNWARPRLPSARIPQAAARLVVWFAGGLIIGLCVRLTATVTGPDIQWPAWWWAGAAFVALELLVHLAVAVRGLPSFYNGKA